MLIDICIPQNNEAELARKAKELGYEAVVFLYEFADRNKILNKKSELKKLKTDLKIYVGTFIRAGKAADLKNLQKIYSDSDLIAVQTFEENVVRSAVTSQFIDVICGITTSRGRDHFDYRRGNLDAVMANLMKEHKISYGLNFAHFLAGKGTGTGASHPLAKILGREVQNIQLTRRKTPILFASFAREPAHMRLPENLAAFGRLLGLNYPQSKVATSSVIEEILKRKEHRRSKEFVRPGVKLVSLCN